VVKVTRKIGDVDIDPGNAAAHCFIFTLIGLRGA
jgi:hypothetical protein